MNIDKNYIVSKSELSMERKRSRYMSRLKAVDEIEARYNAMEKLISKYFDDDDESDESDEWEGEE